MASKTYSVHPTDLPNADPLPDPDKSIRIDNLSSIPLKDYNTAETARRNVEAAMAEWATAQADADAATAMVNEAW